MAIFMVIVRNEKTFEMDADLLEVIGYSSFIVPVKLLVSVSMVVQISMVSD